ncbi:yiaY, partial [Symbiodinium pilosum]
FDSLILAHEYCFGRKRHLPPPAPPLWDCGMLLFLQIYLFLIVLTLLTTVLLVFSALADTFWYMRFTFDTKWGFALAEGFPYTAPVWMGEFGQQVRGSYWLNMLRYLAERDVDFAYWPLNGKKYSEGYFSSSGGFVYFDKPRWEDESFGLLMNDSWSVRHTWKLLDIQALMDSPVKWTPEDYPCQRQRLGNACGY